MAKDLSQRVLKYNQTKRVAPVAASSPGETLDGPDNLVMAKQLP
jgi:hypothetical protein